MESLEKQWQNESEQRQQFSAITHDIRTPLTHIIARAELLQEGITSEYERKGLQQIIDGGNQIKELSEILMDVSINKEKANLYEEHDLPMFFSSISSQTAVLAEAKNQTFAYSALFDKTEGIFNQTEMKRAFFNMLYNAFEYAPKDGLIRLQATIDQTSLLRVCVYNSGSHFSSEEIAFALQKFYRGKKERASDGHYGIGLYTVNEIAKKYNGSVILRNTEDGVEVLFEAYIGNLDAILNGQTSPDFQ